MRIVLLFALCILSSGAAGNLYKQLSEKSRNPADSAALPILWYLPLFLLFLPSVVVGKERTLIPAAIAGGMFLFIAAFLLLESMKQTSLAAAVIIVNLNFLIPVILSVTILKERIALLQLGGTRGSHAGRTRTIDRTARIGYNNGMDHARRSPSADAPERCGLRKAPTG